MIMIQLLAYYSNSSPSDSSGTKNIYTKTVHIEYKSTLDSACQFLILLFSCRLRSKRENQETKGVDFVVQKLGAKPLQSL